MLLTWFCTCGRDGEIRRCSRDANPDLLPIHRKNETPDVKTAKFMLAVKPVVFALSELSTVLKTLPNVDR